MSATLTPGTVEVSWGLVTLDPEERSAVCVRATSDPTIVLLEMQRPGEPRLMWFLHRSVLRSLSSQLRFWSSEFGTGPE